MSAPIPNTGFLSRDNLLGHALCLRERILQGECPYPDAALEANEKFIARLEDRAGGNIAGFGVTYRKHAERLTSQSKIGKTAAVLGAGGLLAFCVACAPLPSNALVAACGAVSVSTLLHVAAGWRTEGRSAWRFIQQLEAWNLRDSSEVPKVPPWQGAMTLADFKLLSRGFAEHVKTFPYAQELIQEHQKLQAQLPDTDHVAVAAVKMDLLQKYRIADRKLARLAVAPLRCLAYGGWIGGCASLAAGFTVAGPVLLGAGLGANLLGYHLSDVAQSGQQDLRAARSLHFWEVAMAAAPAAKPEVVLFRGDAKPADLSIQRSDEDVRLGNVVVKVKRGSQPAEEPLS